MKRLTNAYNLHLTIQLTIKCKKLNEETCCFFDYVEKMPMFYQCCWSDFISKITWKFNDFIHVHCSFNGAQKRRFRIEYIVALIGLWNIICQIVCSLMLFLSVVQILLLHLSITNNANIRFVFTQYVFLWPVNFHC